MTSVEEAAALASSNDLIGASAALGHTFAISRNELLDESNLHVILADFIDARQGGRRRQLRPTRTKISRRDRRHMRPCYCLIGWQAIAGDA